MVPLSLLTFLLWVAFSYSVLSWDSFKSFTWFCRASISPMSKALISCLKLSSLEFWVMVYISLSALWFCPLVTLRLICSSSGPSMSSIEDLLAWAFLFFSATVLKQSLNISFSCSKFFTFACKALMALVIAWLWLSYCLWWSFLVAEWSIEMSL